MEERGWLKVQGHWTFGRLSWSRRRWSFEVEGLDLGCSARSLAFVVKCDTQPLRDLGTFEAGRSRGREL